MEIATRAVPDPSLRVTDRRDTDRRAPAQADEDEPRLKNLAQVAAGAKDVKSTIVTPLSTSVSVGGSLANPDALRAVPGAIKTQSDVEGIGTANLPSSLKEVTTGLGVAGGALGGVVGLHDVLNGVRSGDTDKVVSGAADVTTSAAALASLGVIAGGALLSPAGGVLLSMRGLHQLHEQDRSKKLSGAADLVTAATLLSKVSTLVSSGAVLGLGAVATGLSLVRGLDNIHRSHVEGKRPLLIKGTGDLLSSVGVTALASGLAVWPGLGLLLVGASLPLLHRFSALRRPVDRVVNTADRLASPLAGRMDRAWNRVDAVVTPMVNRAKAALQPLTRPFAPLVRTLGRWGNTIQTTVMGMARRGLDGVEGTRLAAGLDRVMGAVNRHLLPVSEPADSEKD